MNTSQSPSEKLNINKGKIGTSVVHVILLALLFINWFTYPDPPPGQDGITILEGVDKLVILDQLDNENSSAIEIKEEKLINTKENSNSKTGSKKTNQKNLKEDPSSKEEPLNNSKETDKTLKGNAEPNTSENPKIEPLKIPEDQLNLEDQQKADQQKKLFEDLLNANNNSEGNNSNPSGNTDGVPDEAVLNYLGKSNGTVSGGLSGRNGKGPSFKPSKQESGKVTIKICADESGKVTSAKRTQQGTTISLSSPNIELARKAALKWNFKKGERGCGFLTFKIKLQ